MTRTQCEMSHPRRSFRIQCRDAPRTFCDGLRSLDAWPAHTRCAACAVDADGVLHVYVEMTQTVRISAFSHFPGVEVGGGPTGPASRDDHRVAILTMPHALATWEVGSWTRRVRGSGRATIMAQEVQELRGHVASLEQRMLELSTTAAAGTAAPPAAPSTGSTINITINNTNTTTTTNNITDNSTHNTIVVCDFGQEDDSYIPLETRRQRLVAKGTGLLDTVRHLLYDQAHPEHHNVYLLSSRNNLCEVKRGQEWVVRPIRRTSEELMVRALRINSRAPDTGEPVLLDGLSLAARMDHNAWYTDVLRLRQGTSKKDHVCSARAEIGALIRSRRRITTTSH